MDLVTVVCSRDIISFELQLESISKFLKPCTHWIIVNNEDPICPSVDRWEELVSKYYLKFGHSAKILTLADFMPLQGTGWQKQQALKFLISKYINNNYLILDCKNFFIRPQNLEDWTTTIGCGFYEKITDQWWKEASDYYAKNFFKVSPLDEILAVQTPFVFHKKNLDKIGNIESAMQFFNSKDLSTLHSEFLFYSYLVDLNQPPTGEKHTTFWPTTKTNKDIFEILIEQYNHGYLALGFHRNFLTLLKNTEIAKIDQFLEFLELNFRFRGSKMYI